MSILKNKIINNYSIIPNCIIENNNISNGAFRLLCYLYSRPDDWEINNKDIQNKLGIKDSATVSKYWKELEEKSLIKKVRNREKGKFSNYDVELLNNIEFATMEKTNMEKNQYGKNPQWEKPDMDLTNMEKTHNGKNPIHTNTNIYTNNNITNTNNNTNTENSTNKADEKNDSLFKDKFDNSLEFIEDEELRKLFKIWVDYKKTEMKETYKTNQSFLITMNKALKDVNNNKKLLGEAIETSIARRWKGIIITDEMKRKIERETFDF